VTDAAGQYHFSVPARVHLSYLLLQPADLAGGFVIVIDLLRASTTIVHALGHGAAAVIPCEEVDEARAVAARTPGALLGGERSSVRIEGFDLGNSPAEYTRARVAGRTVILTTTNGTRAIRRAAACGDAPTVLAIGCFANFSATLGAALDGGPQARPVHIVCAGVKGEVCLEDTICAGAFALAIARRTGEPLTDDPAALAVEACLRARAQGLEQALSQSRGGRNLIGAGLASDIPLCAEMDTHPLVPLFNPARGTIHAGNR
jgi:2-phosphosulfolactate phosphatase